MPMDIVAPPFLSCCWSPTASQTTKRTIVMPGRLTIRKREASADRMGMTGTHGTRKPRGRSGCV